MGLYRRATASLTLWAASADVRQFTLEPWAQVYSAKCCFVRGLRLKMRRCSQVWKKAWDTSPVHVSGSPGILRKEHIWTPSYHLCCFLILSQLLRMQTPAKLNRAVGLMPLLELRMHHAPCYQSRTFPGAPLQFVLRICQARLLAMRWPSLQRRWVSRPGGSCL